ncbi:MAG TPA: CotH kinase family protein, partial [Kofleriaceae bacterium]|nr:CotH kinase family protein [Kofleriaceae bacterium]
MVRGGLRRAWLLAVAAAACGGGGPGDWEEAAPLFAADRVLEVSIDMAPAAWDALRAQTRTPDQLLDRPDCLGSPFPNPFTYFPATVTVDGELIEAAAVRKKGFIGSLSADKPSLKISVDEMDPERTFHGLEKITLNNSIQDPAYIDQCIAYALFDRAGLPAPRCNFAHVTVNGQPLGTYVHVESVEDELLDHHFGSSDGNLYEGTLSDFLPAWSGTFEKKSNELENDWSDIDAIITAAAAPDAELLAALDEVIALDEFIRFWALESLMRHWDGYAGNINNFWLYEAGGRLHFLPWGTDQVLLDRNPVQGDEAPTSLYATGYLAYRLYRHPEGRQRYLAAVRDLLDQVWDEAWLLGEIDRMAALIGPGITSQEFGPAVMSRREFVMNRRAAVREDLGADWS